MKKIIGYTQGTFDMFHIGHLNLLKNAKDKCDILLVGVNRDELVEKYKNKRPIIHDEERVQIIRAIRYVDKAFITDTLDKFEIYKTVKFDRIFIGDDWINNERWKNTKIEFEKIGVETIFLPYTTGTSSSELRRKLSEYTAEEEDNS